MYSNIPNEQVCSNSGKENLSEMTRGGNLQRNQTQKGTHLYLEGLG